MQTYDILIVEEYSSGGEKKAKFYNIGTAFPSKDGTGFDAIIPPGLAVSGRFMVRPRKSSSAPAEPEDADEIPY